MITLLHSEWTKLRTVRGWAIGAFIAALAMVGLGVLTAAGSHSSYDGGPGVGEVIGHPYVPLGPDGEAVMDDFYFVHQPLVGDGGITVRLSDFTGLVGGPDGSQVAQLQPWSKTGLMLKQDTKQGSAYAAMLRTGEHGVRMQYNFTGDIAGPADAAWLRLTRAGDIITGYASADGTQWTEVGATILKGLPTTVQVGVFAASPFKSNTVQHLGGGGSVTGGPSTATGTFGSIDRQGEWPANAWTGEQIGETFPRVEDRVGFTETEQNLRVTGSGDIAPEVSGGGVPMERILVGAFAALTVIVVLAVLFITTEYRRGMIRATLAATPGRGRVFAAKATVLAMATFALGLVTTAVTVPISLHLLRANGNFIYPTTMLTQVRLVVGTAALLAVAAVFALALGTLLRRSAGAITAVVLLLVLPYLLSTAGALPAGPSQWLLRVTPAAAFAIQQSVPAYPQVLNPYIPAFGFFPLGPWTGFAVLCGYAAVAAVLAVLQLRRRDV
jgi:hypothetical protein